MIRGIIFDCFGVLYVDSTRHFYEQYVTNYEQLRPELLGLNKAFDYGLLSEADMNDAVVKLTGLHLPFVSEHIRGHQERNDLLIDFAQSLRPGHKLGMLSNIGPKAIDRFFSPEERGQLFDGVVLSAEEGMTKPHPLVFTLAAERLGLTPGECVMIDDLEENCAGADAAGMEAILYESNAQVIRDINKLIGSADA